MAINTQSVGVTPRVTEVQLRVVARDEIPAWSEVMEQHHPLGCPRVPGHQIRYVAEFRGQAVALLSFSAPAFHLIDRDRFIGWDERQRCARRHFILQNNRLLVLGHVRHNIASRVLGLAAKRLPLDWQKRFGYAPLMLETFVDPVLFRGSTYLAANWRKIGSTKGFRRDAEDFYVTGSSPKDIYVLPLRPEACEWLRAPTMPAPWCGHQAQVPAAVEAKTFSVAQLGSLFERLAQLPDSRRTQGRRYPLACLLAILVCAVLAGRHGLRGCAAYGRSLTQRQMNALRCWRNPRTGKHQAPVHGTLWQMSRALDDTAVQQAINDWYREVTGEAMAVAVDGKVLRATQHNEEGPLLAVNAVNHAGAPLFSRKTSALAKARNSPPPSSC
jgi:hypothetical protein